MLRFDGYYVEEPSEILNSRSGSADLSYVFLAYLFFDNSKLLWTMQHKREPELIDFSKENFQIPKAVEENWYRVGNEVVIEKSEEYTNNVILKGIREFEFFNVHSRKYLHFVSWNRLNDVEEQGAILKSIFGPFEKGKYKSVHT